MHIVAPWSMPPLQKAYFLRKGCPSPAIKLFLTMKSLLVQGVLSWVGQATPGQEPPRIEARLYDVLFKTSSVADTGDDWLEDLNPQSLTTVEGAMATPRLAAAKAGDK